MSISAMNTNALSSTAAIQKRSALKRWSNHLSEAVHAKLKKLRNDRRELWRIYNGSAYAHSVPRCVWRRHAAVLMYARYHKPDFPQN